MLFPNRIKKFGFAFIVYSSILSSIPLYTATLQEDFQETAFPQELPTELSNLIEQSNANQHANLFEQLSSQQVHHEKEETTQVIEHQLRQILRLYDTLDFVLEHIAGTLSQKKLGQAVNYTQALEKVVELRSIVNTIKKSASSSISPANLKITLSILEVVVADITRHAKANFNTIQQLNMEQCITRATQRQLSPKEVSELIAKLEISISQVREHTRYLGLTHWNKAARKCFSFFARNHVFNHLGTLGVMAFAGYWTLAQFPETLIKRIPVVRSIPGIEKLKQMIGEVPHLDPQTNTIDNAERVGLPMLLTHYFGPQGIGIVNLALSVLVTWKTLTDPFTHNFFNLKLLIIKKWNYILSWVKGAPLDQSKNEFGTKIPKARFHDIIGKEDHKATLQSVISFLEDPEFYLRAGIDINLAYLFCGSSRTGKTYLAEAFAGELYDKLTALGKKIEFMYFSAADVAMFGFERIFTHAQLNGPTVLFIDELDMTNAQREKNSPILAQMLTCLSGYQTSQQDPDRLVILIAATNRPTQLDGALLKPGRFGKLLWFDVPTQEERLHYFKRELHKRAIMTISQEFLASLAQETEGHTFADLNTVIVTALLLAKAENSVLKEYHLEEALDRELRKIVKDDQALSWLTEEQLSCMAAHHAGQAIVSLLLKDTPQISKITLYPIAREVKEEFAYARFDQEGKVKEEKETSLYTYGKLFRQAGTQQRTNSVKGHTFLLNEGKVLLAGSIAEKLLLGNTSAYQAYERTQALELVQTVVFNGIDKEQLSKKDSDLLLKKAFTLLQELEKQTEIMLKESLPVLKGLSAKLKEKRNLTSLEVLDIIKEYAPQAAQSSDNKDK